MPDILILGMEMPRSCADCPFEVFGDCNGGKVKRIMDVDDYTSARSPRCPLVELPPHGDLIDRDALPLPAPIEDEYKYVHEIIKESPVIVPAERRIT